MTTSVLTASPKVAIIYDRTNTRYGGAEYLLAVLAQAFPGADLLTSVSHHQAVWQNKFKHISTTFLQKIPFAKTHHQWFLALMPLAFESLNLDEYDIVISVSSGEAKGVLTKPHQLHIAYVLTPPRYLYQLEQTYLSTANWLKWPIINQLVLLMLKYIKWWDQSVSLRPDMIMALSHQVASRITQAYDRKIKAVVYPPIKPFKIDQQLYPKLPSIAKYYLSVARLVEYKKIDLAIKACRKLQKTLLIVGVGVDLHRLQNLTGDDSWTRPADMNFSTAIQYIAKHQPQICFLGSVHESDLTWLYAQTRAVLAPGIEDFGLVPLEMAQFGKPSLIHAQSGVAEVLTSHLAVHLKEQSLDAMIKGLLKLEKLKISPAKLTSEVKKLSSQIFIQRMTKLVYDEWHSQRMAYDK
ncbi:glycosyltransferase [Patescibacteria group bacterium]|nr:glycosyltransferase [Patescibacteria group bacterium]